MPHSPDARLCRALALEELGRLGEAAADANRVLSAAPPSSVARIAAMLLRRVGVEQANPVPSRVQETNHHGAAPWISTSRLRLHFGMPLPDPLILYEWTTLSLRLTTEIGLTPPLDVERGAPSAARIMLLPLPASTRVPIVEPEPEHPLAYKLEIRQAVDDKSGEPRIEENPAQNVARVAIQRGRAVFEVRAMPGGGWLESGGAIRRASDALSAFVESAKARRAVIWADVEGECSQTVNAMRHGVALNPTTFQIPRVLSSVSPPIEVRLPFGTAAELVETMPERSEAQRTSYAERTIVDQAVREVAVAAEIAARVAAAVDSASVTADAIQSFRPFWLPGEASASDAIGLKPDDIEDTWDVKKEGVIRPLLLAEGSAMIAARVWDSGAFFAHWLAYGDCDDRPSTGLSDLGLNATRLSSPRPSFSTKGAYVLELGAGVGVSGLVAGALGAARVVLTDLEEALPLLRLNADVNAPLCPSTPIVAPLPWGDQEATEAAARLAWVGMHDGKPGLEQQGMGEHLGSMASTKTAEGEGGACANAPDSRCQSRNECGSSSGEPTAPQMLVLCSDLVYDPEQYEPLVETLVTLQRVSKLIAQRDTQIPDSVGKEELAHPAHSEELAAVRGNVHNRQIIASPQNGSGDDSRGTMRVLMGHVSRHPDEHQFFTAIKRHFSLRVLHGHPLKSFMESSTESALRSMQGQRATVVKEHAGDYEASSKGCQGPDDIKSIPVLDEPAVRVIEMVPLER
eukprot:scaffold298883_cov37-Tisochrysis_lutea.AAC.1